MKYLFILGRNEKLSIAEVFSFFEKENNPIASYSLRENGLLIEVEKKLEKGIIEKFGGVIAIGEVLSSGNVKKVLKELESKTLYYGKENNITYSVWSFCAEETLDEFSLFLKKRFKEERLRASEKHLRGLMKTQDKKEIFIVPSKNSLDELYFIFEENSKEDNDENNNIQENRDKHNDKDKITKRVKDINISVGRVTEIFNAEDIENRDMKKPVRREELAISPRLSKIMINLSQIKKGETLVDCFCGIGVILEEALLQNIKVIGIDKDKSAIEGCKQNLEWFNFKKENYKLFCDDSRKISVSGNVLVSEPHLGETLRRIPNKEQAKQILTDFERLIIEVLDNLKDKIDGRIVLTTPYIRTEKGRVGINVERILEQTGLSFSNLGNGNIEIENPIPEFREDQVVGRGILVLEK